jgi:hypothetical protein
MRKMDEISDKNSCFNRAADTEWLFVLLGRDVATPHTIREWVKKRIELGKNRPEDIQIQQALSCANTIERGLHGEI